MKGQAQGQEVESALHHKLSNDTLNKVYGLGVVPAF